jgi:Cu(I)/Ag(I) efflux system membrane fusion protein
MSAKELGEEAGLAQPLHDQTRNTVVGKPRRSALSALGWLVLGAAVGGGALWFAIGAQLIEAPGSHASATPAHAPEPKAPATLYHCPMHPAITADHPSDCPICGMKLVPVKPEAHAHTTGAGAPAERKVVLYRSPMNPQQTSPVPRKDEMGMDYLPVYADETTAETQRELGRASVTVDPARQQMIGLRTAKVTHGAVGGSWRSVGRVEVDPTRVRKTNVKVDGYVEKIFVSFLGQRVSKGEPLFTLYSPTLLVTQNEYLSALKSYRAAGSSGPEPPLLAAARRKLELGDVPASLIAQLEATGAQKTLTFVSPISGVVTAKNVVEGSYLAPGAEPYEITDLSMVWVMVDAYETDIARAKVGMQASMTLSAYPQKVFSGRVQFIAPLLDPSTRTVKVHLHFPNPTGELKPELYGEVTLQAEARHGLTIPTDAIIHSGTRNVVFVAEGEGKFTPVEVQLGERSGDRVEVLSGLAEDQEVITRANFLIDSESQLRASLRGLAEK